MLKKSIITSLLVIGISSVSAVAFADLTIDNKTNMDSTSKSISLNKCSTDLLGGDGVTKAGNPKTINGAQLGVFCMGHLDNCEAEVYASPAGSSDYCERGIDVAYVKLSVTKGIISLTPKDGRFNITVDSPYHVTVTGGA